MRTKQKKDPLQVYQYTPSVSAVMVLQHVVDNLLSHAVKGTGTPLVIHIVQNGDLSENDIQELRAMLDEKAEKPDSKRSVETDQISKKSKEETVMEMFTPFQLLSLSH